MKLTCLAIILAFAGTPAMAGEISPTPAMLTKAKALFKDQASEYRFRQNGPYVRVCAEGLSADTELCGATSLAEIQRIDTSVADFCKHEPNSFPTHSITGGPAMELNYHCIGRRMQRDSYAHIFDAEGYIMRDWQPLQ
jgi:hypothetical protein